MAGGSDPEGAPSSGKSALSLVSELGGAPSRKPVLVLRKVRQVLDAFTPAAPELTARQVHRRTGLPPTTCLRLLQALVEEGFLDRRDDKYRPGLTLLRWARTASEGLDLVAVAAPVLRALRDATGESACLFLRHDTHHTCVAVEPTPHAVIHVLRVGQVLPLHAGSAGRVFLAFDRNASALEQLPLPAYTPTTITDLERLRAAVESTRRDGYAVTREERSIGAASVSAPVFDAGGQLVAVLGIASPVQRFGPDLVPSHTANVTRAAADLSHRLGHDDQEGERRHG
ncbi:MAG: IclR family transcriptional regulator [Actinomycetota bacterium]|nr:IclR family transcriptional regulator [Actinomycetota bacterium]